MQTKVRLKDKKFSKTADIMLNLLIITAGASIQTQLFSFRYIFMISAVIFIVFTVIMLISGSELTEVLRKKTALSAFAAFLFINVLVKQIISLNESGFSLSLLSGYGNIIYITFGICLMSAYPDSKKIIFFVSYVISFTAIFMFTGLNTLYDKSHVCRTVGAFNNPNTFALYAAVSFFASLILLKSIKKPYRFVFIFTAAAGAAGMINSSCRAIVIGAVVSAAAAGVLYVFKKWRKIPKISKESVIILSAVLILTAVLVQVYFPLRENAVIDYYKKRTSTSAGSEEPEIISGIDRVLSSDGLALNASYKGNLRFAIWKGYTEKINDFFWFGCASASKETLYINSIKTEYAPHNMLVYVFYKFGAAGFALFCLILVNVCVVIFKTKNINRNFILILICLGTLIFYGLLHDAVNKSIFWVVLPSFLFYQDSENSQHTAELSV